MHALCISSGVETEAEFNPYTPPQSQRVLDESSPEAMRLAHLRHESEIKGVGLLYALFGGLMLFPLVLSLREGMWRRDFSIWFFLLLITLGLLVLGIGMRRLAPWARVPVALISFLAGVMSIFTIVGPLVNGYILWLMLSAKGRKVLSPEYQMIVDLTPDVKNRTSCVAVLLIFMLLLVVGSILMALMVPALSNR